MTSPQSIHPPFHNCIWVNCRSPHSSDVEALTDSPAARRHALHEAAGESPWKADARQKPPAPRAPTPHKQAVRGKKAYKVQAAKGKKGAPLKVIPLGSTPTHPLYRWLLMAGTIVMEMCLLILVTVLRSISLCGGLKAGHGDPLLLPTSPASICTLMTSIDTNLSGF